MSMHSKCNEISEGRWFVAKKGEKKQDCKRRKEGKPESNASEV